MARKRTRGAAHRPRRGRSWRRRRGNPAHEGGHGPGEGEGRRPHRGASQGEAQVSPSHGVREERRDEPESDLHRGAAELREVLGGARPRASLVQALEEGARVEAALREVVRRRQAQRGLQLHRSPRERPAQDEGCAHLGGRAGRFAGPDLLGSLPRGQSLRGRAEAARRPQGRPDHHLHADGPGAADRDAGLRADRRRPQRHLRRLLARGGPRADPRRRVDAGDHRRRRLSPRRHGAAQEEHRRRAARSAPTSRPSSCSSAPASRSRCRAAATSGGTTSSRTRRPAVRPSRWTPRTCCTCSTRPARPASPRASSTRPAAI